MHPLNSVQFSTARQAFRARQYPSFFASLVSSVTVEHVANCDDSVNAATLIDVGRIMQR